MIPPDSRHDQSISLLRQALLCNVCNEILRRERSTSTWNLTPYSLYRRVRIAHRSYHRQSYLFSHLFQSRMVFSCNFPQCGFRVNISSLHYVSPFQFVLNGTRSYRTIITPWIWGKMTKPVEKNRDLQKTSLCVCINYCNSAIRVSSTFITLRCPSGGSAFNFSEISVA